MPSTPYAKVLISVNGGATTSGGITVTGGDTITLTGESTVGWRSARWELYGYPDEWNTTPTGWALGADGVMRSTSLTPHAIDLPEIADAWGKWLVRLVVNNAETDSSADDYNANLIDDTSGWQTLSPNGLRDLGTQESTQFGGALRSWAGDWQTSLRTLDAQIGTVTTLTSVNADTNVAHTIAVADESAVYAILYALGRTAGGDTGLFIYSDLFGREGGGNTTRLVGDANTDLGTKQTAGASTWAAALSVSGHNFLATVTGAADTTISWRVMVKTFVL